MTSTGQRGAGSFDGCSWGLPASLRCSCIHVGQYEHSAPQGSVVYQHAPCRRKVCCRSLHCGHTQCRPSIASRRPIQCPAAAARASRGAAAPGRPASAAQRVSASLQATGACRCSSPAAWLTAQRCPLAVQTMTVTVLASGKIHLRHEREPAGNCLWRWGGARFTHLEGPGARGSSVRGEQHDEREKHQPHVWLQFRRTPVRYCRGSPLPRHTSCHSMSIASIGPASS